MTHNKYLMKKVPKIAHFGPNVKWMANGLGRMENYFVGMNVHQNAPAGKNISIAINPLAYL